MTATVSLPEGFTPFNAFEMHFGVQVPDPLTFVVGPRWLNSPQIYPRQGTLIKIIFARLDLLTDYDHAVIDEWEERFRRTGDEGIVPGVRDRMRYLNLHGSPWFREVLFAMGRRAGKGHIAARAQAYVIWNYLATGDPQEHFGVDRGKKLCCLVFAGKRDQAKATVFGDIVNVVTNSECFTPYINDTMTEKLSIYAPHDFIRMERLRARGLSVKRDMATFEIMPKESTPMAGRGPTSFSLAFDEMAHITASGTARSADEVYKAAKPSTDQFKDWAFLIEPSSPWQRMGQFYINATEAITLDERGVPLRPNWLLVQLPSWDIYKDWERAHEIPMFPSGFTGDLGEYTDIEPLYYPPMRGAIQDFDDEMRREKKSNPDTFAVEREAKWANVLDAYLREGMIDKVFEPWEQRPAQYGPPEIIAQTGGIMALTYLSHGDPAKVNDTFGYAVAHAEVDAEGRSHAVFDVVGSFNPADYDDHILDYDQIEDWFWENVILKFHPDQVTFDQFNSTGFIQRLNKRIRARKLPKRTTVFETPVTRAGDWEEKESAKSAIYMGLVHAPECEQLRDELKYLQLVNGRVDHPSAGPVQSKDVADCFTHLIHDLIGEQTAALIRGDLAAFVPQGMGQPMPFARQMGGDSTPTQEERASAEDRQVLSRMRGSFRNGNPFGGTEGRPDRGGMQRRRW